MISDNNLSKIQEFANDNGFYFSKFFDVHGNTAGVRARYGDRELIYDSCENTINVYDLDVNGNFESFVTEMKLLKVMEIIGNMIKAAIKDV